MLVKHIFLYLFIALTATVSAAQGFNIKEYSVANNLPGSFIQKIFSDSYGYLWIGTYGSLLRYNGFTFTKFTSADGLPGGLNIITYEDSDHTLWGVNDHNTSNAVIFYKNGKFSALSFSAADSVHYIFSVYKTNDAVINACTDNGVFMYKEHKWQKIDLNVNKTDLPVRQVLTEDNGSMLICSYLSLIKKNTGGRNETILRTTKEKAFNYIIPIEKSKSYLVLKSDELMMYDGKSIYSLTHNFFENDFIISATASNKGAIYVCGITKGLYCISENKLDKIQFASDPGFGFMHGLCEDREGNIWAGSLKLFRITSSCITHFTANNGLLTSDIRSVLFTREGDAYFGFKAFTLWKQEHFIPATALVNNSMLEKMYGHILYYMEEDDKQRIWMMVHPNELFRYYNGKMEDITAFFNPGRKRIWQIRYDAFDSSVYISADSLLQIKNDRLINKIPLSVNNIAEKPSALCVDKLHNLWLSTTTGKVGYFSMNNMQLHTEENVSSTKSVTRLISADDGSVWASTNYDGILHYKIDSKGKVVTLDSVNEKKDLPSNSVSDICFDKAGNLWAATEKGIVKLVFDTSAVNHKIISSQVVTYDEGLDAESLVETHLGVDTSGNIWVTTFNGVYRINNQNNFAVPVPPKTYIEKILINGDTTNGLKFSGNTTAYFNTPLQPQLPYNRNSINIYFSTIAYAQQEEIEAQYQLKGLNNEWMDISPNSSASFAGLSPGNYTFLIRSRRKNDAWGEPLAFNFTILYPFWQTWWFLMLVVISATAFLVFIFRKRISQLNKKAALQHQVLELEMQALKARMNPHFIYNAMNSIQSLVINDEPESAVRYLGKFAKLLRQVLDNSDKPLIPLSSEISSLQLYIELETLRLHVDFDYSITVHSSINTEEELIPPLVLQPYVENALWHGLSNKEGKKKLSVNIFSEDNMLIAEITDNGIGRAKAEEIKSKSNKNAISKGLDITSRRLSLLNKTNLSPVIIKDLYDENKMACGTSVTLYIKLFRK